MGNNPGRYIYYQKWKVLGARKYRPLEGHSQSVGSVAFSPDGRTAKQSPQAQMTTPSNSGMPQQVKSNRPLQAIPTQLSQWPSHPTAEQSPQAQMMTPSNTGMPKQAKSDRPSRAILNQFGQWPSHQMAKKQPLRYPWRTTG